MKSFKKTAIIAGLAIGLSVSSVAGSIPVSVFAATSQTETTMEEKKDSLFDSVKRFFSGNAKKFSTVQKKNNSQTGKSGSAKKTGEGVVTVKKSAEKADVQAKDISDKFTDNQDDQITVTNAEAEIVILPNPTREGYMFRHWNTEKDDSGKIYYAGNAFTIGSEDTLYAIWDKEPSEDDEDDAVITDDNAAVENTETADENSSEEDAATMTTETNEKVEYGFH